MSRRGRDDVAVRLEGSGGADPGVVGVVDAWSPGGELPDAQLGRNFLFFLFVRRKARDIDQWNSLGHFPRLLCRHDDF